MKKSTLYILFISILLFNLSCKQDQTAVNSINTIRNSVAETTSPYLTQDQNGNAVLCWTERSEIDSLYRLKYAIYDVITNEFGDAVTVTPSKGTKASPESMNKVAFKSDGTVIAVFTRKFENQRNPFAGAILYSISKDKGSSWSEPQYLHSDTSHAYGRSYFDLARMKDGEICAVWLDGRYGKSAPGSALFFASTSRDAGFNNEKCIDRNTCECCRTDLMVANDGKLHVAYRSIMFPERLLGKQVRDIAYISSADHGITFQKTKTISQDNWAIEGCPHTGPSLAADDREVYALWFTAGNSPGVYFNSCEGPTQSFSPRELQSAAAQHPQLTSLQDGKLAMVWEEIAMTKAAPAEKSSHQHGMASHNKSGSLSKISLKVLKEGKEPIKMDLTDGNQADNHAVLTGINNGVLVAWVTEDKNTSAIRYTFVKTDE